MARDEAKRERKEAWRRKNIHLVTPENDIKFRGPFTYRHLRVMGWLFLLLGQLAIVFGTATSMKLADFAAASAVLQSFAALAPSLFLIAAFSQVLVAKDGYRNLFILYGGGSIGIFALFTLIYFHFIEGIFGALGDASLGAGLMQIANQNGYFTINIFIDLILCALLTAFLNYRPVKFFQGKKLIIFRLFAILPIAYEIVSIVLKTLSAESIIALHPIVFPLLTTKPPMAFFIFVAVAFFTKNRERHFLKHGKTYEDYRRFMDSNVNRAHFSSFFILMIILACAVDLLAVIIVVLVKNSQFQALGITDPETLDYFITDLVNGILAVGFGKTLPMLLLIPIIIFYDYRRTFNNKIVDILIPVGGILLIMILYIEGMFQVARLAIIKAVEESKQEPKDYAAMLFNHFWRLR